MTREDYYNLHRYCPECGNREHMITCVPVRTRNWIYAIDENLVWCECGWNGIKHEMVEKKVLKDKDT